MAVLGHQAHDVDEITRLADGLFVFAATAVRYIRAGSARLDPQELLHFLCDGEVLVDLEKLYLHIVNEAIPVLEEVTRLAQRSYNISLSILTTILGLLEPMDPKELGAFLGFDEESVRKALTPLSAVIHVPEMGPVHIIHQSFREFMTSTKSKLHKHRMDLLCGTEKQKQEFASKVLQTMQDKLKFNICDLPTSHLKNAEIPGLEQKLKTCIPMYIRYCCRFWADHLAAVTINAENSKIAKKFLETKCLFWLEVLSLLEIMSTASLALSKFRAWSNVWRVF
jgi:hypothetical protein